MVMCWGANYALVKVLLRDLQPRAFNSARLSIASVIFLAAIGASTALRHRVPARRVGLVTTPPAGTEGRAIFRTGAPVTPRDWAVLFVLGLIGQFGYQAFFAEGMARTSVANASLTIGCTPIMVSIVSAALGRDRLGATHWAGIAASAIGMYLVVGVGVRMTDESFSGDLLMLACVLCWTVYTIAGREPLLRHSPLVVTGLSMAIGTAIYIPYAWSAIQATGWSTLPVSVWVGLGVSALLALNVGYVIWYMGVQRLGSARTSVYSSLVPVAALVTAALWLGESIGGLKLAGAALVIGGLLVTRLRMPIGDEGCAPAGE